MDFSRVINPVTSLASTVWNTVSTGISWSGRTISKGINSIPGLSTLANRTVSVVKSRFFVAGSCFAFGAASAKCAYDRYTKTPKQDKAAQMNAIKKAAIPALFAVAGAVAGAVSLRKL